METREKTYEKGNYAGKTKTIAVGLKGLYRWENGTWRIKKAGEPSINLRVRTPEAAAALYVEWELDPYALREKLSQHVKIPSTKKAFEMWLENGKNSRSRWQSKCQFEREFLSSSGLGDRCVRHIRPVHAEIWVKCIRHLAHNTQVNRVTLAKNFGIYMINMGWIMQNPFRHLGPTQEGPTGQARRQMVDPDMLKAACDAMPNDWSRCALRVLWAMGMSPIDLFTAEPDRISPARATLNIIRQKIRFRITRSHHIPIADELVLRDLMLICNQNLLDRKIGIQAKSRVRELSRYVANYLRKNPQVKWSPAALRHTRITVWLRQGCNVLDVMRWAGHASVAQTMVYVEDVPFIPPPPSGLPE